MLYNITVQYYGIINRIINQQAMCNYCYLKGCGVFSRHHFPFLSLLTLFLRLVHSFCLSFCLSIFISLSPSVPPLVSFSLLISSYFSLSLFLSLSLCLILSFSLCLLNLPLFLSLSPSLSFNLRYDTSLSWSASSISMAQPSHVSRKIPETPLPGKCDNHFKILKLTLFFIEKAFLFYFLLLLQGRK